MKQFSLFHFVAITEKMGCGCEAQCSRTCGENYTPQGKSACFVASYVVKKNYNYDFPFGSVNPPSHSRECFALFAIAEGCLLLNMG